MPKTSTVRHHFNMACPGCGSDKAIHITIEAKALLTPDGTEPAGSHHWDDRSHAFCKTCNHRGTVLDFRIEQHPERTYSHVFTLAYELTSNHPEGSDLNGHQHRIALLQRIAGLPGDELVEAVGLPDSTDHILDEDCSHA